MKNKTLNDNENCKLKKKLNKNQFYIMSAAMLQILTNIYTNLFRVSSCFALNIYQTSVDNEIKKTTSSCHFSKNRTTHSEFRRTSPLSCKESYKIIRDVYIRGQAVAVMIDDRRFTSQNKTRRAASFIYDVELNQLPIDAAWQYNRSFFRA